MIEETTGESYSLERAFVSGLVGNVLFGEPVAKFSFSRKIAAQAMGCVAPVLPAEKLADFRAGLMYSGIWNDVIIVCWLCTLRDQIETSAEYKAGSFTPDRAIIQPVEANAKAREWAESAGLDDMDGDKFLEAWQMFLGIMFAIDRSVFELADEKTNAPTPPGGPPPKTKPGQPSKRKSSRASHGSPGKARPSSGKK